MTQNKQNTIHAKRINVYLRDLGYGTRRSVEKLVTDGKVLINNKKAVLSDTVLPRDTVTVDKKAIPRASDYIYLAFNKPVGISTLPDVGVQSIKDIIGEYGDKVFPVGRLDKDSSGLIILTNDGRITDRLLDSKNNFEKEYRVELNKKINNQILKGAKEGLKIGGFKTKPAKMRKVTEYIFEIILTEGQNRQIRRLCASFGYDVIALKRFRILNIEIGDLRSGSYRTLKKTEQKEFLQTLGIS